MKRIIALAALLCALFAAAPSWAQSWNACASASSCVVANAAATLIDSYITTGAASGWLFVLNQATTPSNGTLTAGDGAGDFQDCIQVGANSPAGLTTAGTGLPEGFSAGITLAFSSTACPVLTLSTVPFLKARFIYR